jgi:hypothetical protein
MDIGKFIKNASRERTSLTNFAVQTLHEEQEIREFYTAYVSYLAAKGVDSVVRDDPERYARMGLEYSLRSYPHSDAWTAVIPLADIEEEPRHMTTSLGTIHTMSRSRRAGGQD